MVGAFLTPVGVDTLLAALLRGERVTLPLVYHFALFFGLRMANLTRDFVAHLSKSNSSKSDSVSKSPYISKGINLKDLHVPASPPS